MDDKAHTLMLRIFKDIPDPRMQGKVVHKLHDILVIAVCSIIAGPGQSHEIFYRKSSLLLLAQS
jgi:hypothetical protein